MREINKESHSERLVRRSFGECGSEESLQSEDLVKRDSSSFALRMALMGLFTFCFMSVLSFPFSPVSAESKPKISGMISDEERPRNVEDRIFSGELSDMMDSLEDELYNVLPESDEMVAYYKDLVRSTPSYMVEYIAAMLNRTPGVPEPVLAIPEVKAWKGKYPTRIAPEMQAYAKKYIRDMSPNLYFMLAPETWGHNPQGISREIAEYKDMQKDYVFVIDETKPFFSSGTRPRSRLGHPDLVPKELFMTGPDAPKQKKRTDDIFPREKMLRFIKASKAWVAFVHQDEAILQDLQKRMAVMDYAATPEDAVSPCAVQLKSLENMGYGKVFDDVIKMEKFKRDDYVALCDKLVKAYRIGNLTLEKAFWVENQSKNMGFNEWKARTRLKNKDEYFKMFDATDEEGRAVEPYRKDLKILFEDEPLIIYMDLPFGGHNNN